MPEENDSNAESSRQIEQQSTKKKKRAYLMRKSAVAPLKRDNGLLFGNISHPSPTQGKEQEMENDKKRKQPTFWEREVEASRLFLKFRCTVHSHLLLFIIADRRLQRFSKFHVVIVEALQTL